MPNVGDLMVWWVPQAPMQAFKVDVGSIEEGVKIMDILADYDAFQYEHNVKGDYANIGGLCQWDGEEWVDWWDEISMTDNPWEWIEEQRLT